MSLAISNLLLLDDLIEYLLLLLQEPFFFG